jgi:ribose transport system permease protein
MGSPASTSKARHVLNALGPFIGLVFVIGLFCLSSEVRPYFLTGANFKIILTQTVIVAIGALGMTMIIISGGIDLSVGSVVALTSVVGALLINRHFFFNVDLARPLAAAGLPLDWVRTIGGYVKIAPVVLATVLAGGVIGVINGSIIGALRMMPFIVTLGMMGIGRGAAKWLADNQTVNPAESAVNNIMGLKKPMQLLPLPPGVWIALGLAVFMSIIMRRTVFGRYIFAIGSNEATARLCGIRVQLHKVLIYSLAGLFF